MTIEATILKASNNVRHGGMFENHEHTINIHIKDCGAEPILTAAYLVQEYLADTTKSSGPLAVVGTAFKTKGDSGWGNYLPNTEFGEWRVRNVNVVPHGQDNNAWQVTISQTNMGMMYNTADTPALYGVPSITVNNVARTRNVNAWRSSPEMWTESIGCTYDAGESTNGWGAIFTNPSSDWAFCNTERDIDGTPIDINGGNAVSFNVSQEQITIEFITRSPYVDAENNTKNDVQWTNKFWLNNLINTRNAENWFGYDKGYLLVLDIAVQPLHHEFKRITMTLLYDEWKHASQRPWVTKTGIVAATNTCSTDPPEEGQPLINLTASVVGWIQPYQKLGSFGTDPQEALFPTYVFDDAWLKLAGANSTTYAPATEEDCA